MTKDLLVDEPLSTDVSQGYASNRTTPFTTPNVSPAKSQPVNPYNTPQASPVRRNIFKTETEAIQEAVGELHISPKKGDTTSQELFKPTRGVKKRGRDELDDSSDASADGEYEDVSEPEKVKASPERVKKPLLKKKTTAVSAQEKSSLVLGGDDTEETDVNPFLVSRADP